MESILDAEINAALARLVGTRLTDLGRAADLQWFALTAPGGHPDYSLHLMCPWRLRTDTELLVGYGDYWRPAAADTPDDAYERGKVGARWRDVRCATARASVGGSAVVEAVETDGLGGFVLTLSGGLRLEVFPDASRAPHDEVEFWRMFESGGKSEHFVVGSNGIDRVAEA